MLVLASVVAVLHGAAVLLMLTGSLLALRWPRLLWAHAPVALAVLGVHLAGAPCPLTVLEDALRARAGAPPLPDGFLGTYAYGPLGLDQAATGTQVGTYVLAVGLNALGYGLLATRGRWVTGTSPGGRAGLPATRRSAPGPGRPRCAPRRRTPAPPAAAHPAGRRTS
ncbi:DUF2784 domain-containing protein [Geodermatophilus sp. SYSU D00758]